MHERHSERHGKRFAHAQRSGHEGHEPGGYGHGDHDHLGDGHRGGDGCRARRGHRHGGGGRHEHGHGGGARGSGRIFNHGELRLVVLALIAEQPRHGYQIIKEIEDRLAGSYSPSPGVIYPTLTLLDELGQATVEEKDGRKLYAITPEGLAYLDVHKAALDAALARMKGVNAAHGGGMAPQLIRAMENLKLALRLRQGRGPLTEEQLTTIATALDAAALAIERS